MRKVDWNTEARKGALKAVERVILRDVLAHPVSDIEAAARAYVAAREAEWPADLRVREWPR